VALAGLALLRWSDQCLGKNLSVTLRVRAEHTLITQGPYARIRHPIYTAGLAFAAGQSLVAANYLLSVLLVLPLAALVAERMGREERMMVEAFGQEYRQYMQVTGRLVPRRWKWH
jgi:protein-S-isoprenylcysteine O-methyltransferase Ste14